MSSETAFIPKNVFIVGATGWVGAQITQALLDKKAFNLKLLIRKDTFEKKKALLDGFKAAGATLVEGDTSSVAALTEVFKGSDTVLSALGGDGLNSGEQNNIFEAVKAAGVRRFVPSEFGFEIEDENDFVLGGKVKLRHELINSGIEYTLIFTSGFYEFLFSPAVGFNLKEEKVNLGGDGNHPFSTIHTSDIAKYVAEILLDPTSKNRKIHILGETTTYNQAVKIFEEAQGKKLEVTYTPVEDLKAFVADDKNDFVARILTHLKYLVNATNQQFDTTDHSRYAAQVQPKSLKQFAQSA